MKGTKGYNPIETAEKLRPRIIDLENKKVLLASFIGVSQAKDIPKCQVMDYFRIKIYEKPEEIKKGIYNFLIDSDRKINILRLSGEDPLLVPEIIVWLIEAIEKFELQDYIYIWIDTNLATGNFYWKYLSDKQREKIRNFKNIGFMGCYKGFDEESFTKTCGADSRFFSEQFKIHRKLIDEGLDVYTYLYPLAYSDKNLKERIVSFIERLGKEVNEYAPLRLTTPYTKVYFPTLTRLTPEREKALELQLVAMGIWKEEMKRRFGYKADLLPHQIPVK